MKPSHNTIVTHFHDASRVTYETLNLFASHASLEILGADASHFEVETHRQFASQGMDEIQGLAALGGWS